MDTITQFFSWYNELTKGNQGLSAAIALWLLTTLTVSLRKLPSSLWRWCYYHAVYEITVYYSSNYNDVRTYALVMDFASEVLAGRTKRVKIGYENGSSMIQLGLGRHYGFYKGRFIWFTVMELDSSGTETQKLSVKVGLLSLNTQFRDMVSSQFKVPGRSHQIMQLNPDGCYNILSDIEPRLASTVSTNEDTHILIGEEIARFSASRDWYIQNGIPHKLVILLEGPPGTGKTSITRYLASQMSTDMYLFPREGWSPPVLSMMPTTTDGSNLVVIEDLDRIPFSDVGNTEQSTSPMTRSLSSKSLSTLINVLDGPYAPSNTVIVITVNDVDKLPDVMLRDMRIDRRYHIGLLNNESIHRFIERRYIEHKTAAYRLIDFKDIEGAKLAKLFTLYPEDYENFIEVLLEQSQNA
jgi:hypothetical protein